MKKCIVFLRVSSQKQDLTAQKEAVLKTALKEYSEEEIVVVEGKESAIKLAEMERQTLNEMKEVVEKHTSIECIYFFAVDRLARRVSVVMSIKEWADSKKINLVFLNPYPFSTWFKSTEGEWKKNDISDVYLMFLSFGAKMEMQIKGERFAAAKALNKAQGKPNGKVIYGYTTNKDGYVTYNEKESKIVKWVFESYLNKNMSTTQLYDEGVELGYWQNKRDKAAKAGHIRRILKEYRYSGDSDKNGVKYPAIVGRKDVDAAIKLMKEKKIKPKSYTKNILLCKSILKDEETGYTLVADTCKAKYKCTQQGYGLSMNIVEYVCWRTAAEAKWNLITHADDGQEDKIKAEIEEIEVKYSNVMQYLDKVIQPRYEKAYDAYVNGNGRITEAMYNKTVKEIDKEREENEVKATNLSKRRYELLHILDEFQKKEKLNISIYSVKDISNEKQRQEIVNECITGMTVKKIGDKKYIIKVHHVLPLSPNEYYYVNRGNKSELYLINGLYNEKRINVYEGLYTGVLIDIMGEVEKRFLRRDR